MMLHQDTPPARFHLKRSLGSERSGLFLSQAQLTAGIYECEGRPDPKLLRRLLHGTGVGIVVHNYFSADEAACITRNFVEAERHDRADGVEATEVGGGAFVVASVQAQFRAYQESSGLVSLLFEGTRNFVDETMLDLQRSARRHQRVRPVHFNGLPAAPLRAVAWRGKSEGWLLLQHEDHGQMRTASLACTEFAFLADPIAINLYPAVGREGGELRVYGWAPSAATRMALGLSETGYPYPEEILEGIPWVDLAPEPGMAIFLRGAFVHGVRRGVAEQDAPRIVVNGFAARTLDGSEILRWC